MVDARDIYRAFWTGLVPTSNRLTGFRLRQATKRPYVEVCRLGFCLRYQVPEGAENAAALFVIGRSDGDEIYASLQEHRASIEADFGGPLHWSGDEGTPWPPYALVSVIPCPPLRESAQEKWPAVQDQILTRWYAWSRRWCPICSPG